MDAKMATGEENPKAQAEDRKDKLSFGKQHKDGLGRGPTLARGMLFLLAVVAIALALGFTFTRLRESDPAEGDGTIVVECETCPDNVILGEVTVDLTVKGCNCTRAETLADIVAMGCTVQFSGVWPAPFYTSPNFTIYTDPTQANTCEYSVPRCEAEVGPDTICGSSPTTCAEALSLVPDARWLCMDIEVWDMCRENEISDADLNYYCVNGPNRLRRLKPLEGRYIQDLTSGQYEVEESREWLHVIHGTANSLLYLKRANKTHYQVGEMDIPYSEGMYYVGEGWVTTLTDILCDNTVKFTRPRDLQGLLAVARSERHSGQSCGAYDIMIEYDDGGVDGLLEMLPPEDARREYGELSFPGVRGLSSFDDGCRHDSCAEECSDGEMNFDYWKMRWKINGTAIVIDDQIGHLHAHGVTDIKTNGHILPSNCANFPGSTPTLYSHWARPVFVAKDIENRAIYEQAKFYWCGCKRSGASMSFMIKGLKSLDWHYYSGVRGQTLYASCDEGEASGDSKYWCFRNAAHCLAEINGDYLNVYGTAGGCYIYLKYVSKEGYSDGREVWQDRSYCGCEGENLESHTVEDVSC